MQESYIDISWLAYTLSYYIGDLILFKVPSVAYNQFEGWIGSIYKSNIERSLRKYWQNRFRLFEKWERTYWYGDKLYITPKKIGAIEQ
jgi:hypothetical protein